MQLIQCVKKLYIYIYIRSVPIRDVSLKTDQKQWTIGRGGERVSVISVLIVCHDDYDDIYCNKRQTVLFYHDYTRRSFQARIELRLTLQ